MRRRAARTWWQRALERIGVGVHTQEDWQPPPEITAAAPGRYIFVRNDEVSPFRDVMRWLQESFDLPKLVAGGCTGIIHQHGWAAIGPFSSDEEAQRRMTRARERAAVLGLRALCFSFERPQMVAWGEGAGP